MIPKRMDPKTARELRLILSRLNIAKSKVTIDLDKNTIEEVDDDDYSVQDILDSAGALTPERAVEMLDHAKHMREEWDQ